MSAQAITFYNRLLAILTLVALVAIVALLVFRAVRGRDAVDAIGSYAMWAAWVVAAGATAGSLIYSEVIHFLPCRLCWFQRIAMYPMAVILLIGSIRKEVTAKLYALPFAFGGLAISIWHYLTQLYPSLEGGACDPNNPCSARYVEVFGFITIPFMAGVAFTLIAVLLTFYVRASNHE